MATLQSTVCHTTRQMESSISARPRKPFATLHCRRGKASLTKQRSCRTGRSRAGTSVVVRAANAAEKLSDSDISTLLAGDEYAMDISSITEGSEKETYIGQGSGVNEGTGIGSLVGFVKAAVGKVLAWRNRPVYEELWKVIEDDLLAMAQARVPELKPHKNFFTDEPGPYAFKNPSGSTEAEVAAYKGGAVDWITTAKFFSDELGFGNLRIDGWLTRDTRAPHLQIHLCIVFNVLFIYIDLVPRANLLLDDEYNDYVYGAPKSTGKALNDYYVQCVEDKDFTPYESKSHVVRAFMVSPGTLLYTVKYSKENFAKVRSIARDYMQIWLELMEEREGVLVKGLGTREAQAELLQKDVRVRQFCGRDPDTKNVANIFGLELTDKLVRTLWGDPDDPIWGAKKKQEEEEEEEEEVPGPRASPAPGSPGGSGGLNEACSAWARLESALDRALLPILDPRGPSRAGFGLQPSAHSEPAATWTVGGVAGWVAGYEPSPPGRGRVPWAVRYGLEQEVGGGAEAGARRRSYGCNVWAAGSVGCPHLSVYVGVSGTKATVIVDYLPRYDFASREGRAHLARYYAPGSARWAALQGREGVAVGRSRDPNVRALQGPNALMLTTDVADSPLLDLFEQLLSDHVGQWVQWMHDDADVVEGDEARMRLARRDRAVREALRDHETRAGAPFMGQELANKLSSAMAGPLHEL